MSERNINKRPAEVKNIRTRPAAGIDRAIIDDDEETVALELVDYGGQRVDRVEIPLAALRKSYIEARYAIMLVSGIDLRVPQLLDGRTRDADDRRVEWARIVWTALAAGEGEVQE